MWKEFRIAVSFLTRLPLTYKGEWDEKSFSRASVFYPVVGLIVGLCVAVVAALLKLTGYYDVAAVCALIEAECGIPASRVYVKYTEYDKWGWNGSNF